MKLAIALLALVMSTAVGAAPPKPKLMDFSPDTLIAEDAAKAIMAEHIPAKVWKLYPPNKWAIVSQVEGGVTPTGTCVITARVMLLPLTSTLKYVMLRPEKIATAFDAKPSTSMEACGALAKEKLKDATLGVVSALVKI